MAKKISKSIVRGLDRLRKVFSGTPEKPSASKTSAKRAERRPSRAPADQTASKGDAPEAPEATPDKKKPKAQPWFRHRQRW